MFAIPDLNFRRGLGLLFTGPWVTIFGLSLVGLGGIGDSGAISLLVGFTVVIVGGIILARGYATITTMPPIGPSPPG